MKRVKAACITQTLHFLLKEDAEHDYAVRMVHEEVKKYKEHLDKSKTQIQETTRNYSEITITWNVSVISCIFILND